MHVLLRVVGALVGIVLVLLAILYGASEWVLRRSHSVPVEQVAVPKDPASAAATWTKAPAS